MQFVRGTDPLVKHRLASTRSLGSNPPSVSITVASKSKEYVS